MKKFLIVGAVVLAVILVLGIAGCSSIPTKNILTENDYSNIGNMYIWPKIVQDGEYFYYIGFDTPNLIKVRKDDFDLIKPENLGEDIDSIFLPADGPIYYLNNEDAGSIYTIDKDGNNKTKLADMTCTELITLEDKIYFTNADGLYSMNMDGSDLKSVYSEAVENVFPYGSYLYFIQTYEDIPEYIYIINDALLTNESVIRLTGHK